MKLFNLTDHPDFISTTIHIRGGKISAGESIDVKDVDSRLLTRKDMAIGIPPQWYQDWKFPKKVQETLQTISDEIMQEVKESLDKSQEKKPTKKK